ncbi:hypothetical protein DV495_003263 [Geotrichum candidum]|uniref:Similar to Saccharomyces cerevisiae YHR006W STP2 Transcription factor, activated by proteolytic processing in response to signals from the SPS sensor system for external amino acids n=1 Tax=Geotrichum candidum TaxID=1173061 RepID=A0A0J9X8Z4_GEOCN|nr:hypothetical protein DV452_002508 [Geotrichum candidum]KAI9211548.1 hypothetical protein DS838_003561 [Geotrichum bryndzae]KAF5126753.1 hypothetical protein DV495_003263 [Geotrichum candidum]KAF7498344.1 hypothetical protein DV113_003632 [Geotrichum candidum]KAI8135854.1 hypothetical protein DUD61_000479 [Geotrichum candidum]
MFAATSQPISDIEAIKMSSLSPPLSDAQTAAPSSAASNQSSQTEKLSALDTLSLAASAALNQRDPKQAVASTGASPAALPSFASSEQRSGTASNEPVSPSAQPAASTSSSSNNSNLAMLCGEAASKSPEHITSGHNNKYTTASAPNHNLFSQQQHMQPSTPDDSDFISPGLRAGSGSPTSSSLQFPSNSTLPNLSTLLPHHPLPLASSTTPPASTSDLTESRWSYQKPSHKHHLSPPASVGNGSLLSQPENPIHPQLAALSGINASNGSADTFPSTNGSSAYSPMSIASLTTPMYSSNNNSSNSNNNSNNNNTSNSSINNEHPMILPKDGQEYPSNKRKFYSGIMETSFDPNNPNLAKANNTDNSNNPTITDNSINALTINSNNLNTQNNSSSARKKRQCTQCNGWFSNLATHKSTHLADNSRPHTCEVCNRGFARPNDLFRHSKSHRGDAPFRCPLFVRGPLPNHAFGNLEPSCHQNGGFSRCDTYKNHLKAMHFEYPPGTKKKQRNGMKGSCKACGQSFASSDAWITEHIEPGNCAVIKQIKALKDANQL